MRDLIKIWRQNGFTLRLWDTNSQDYRGQTRLDYELKDGRRIIFSGGDFCGSPPYADDSRPTIACLLSFLILQPGDTDKEYFEDYTPLQLDWCQSARRDELVSIQIEMEEQS